MEENKTYTKEDIMAITIRILENIKVPVKLKRDISDPIEAALGNLAVVMDIMAAEKKEENEEADAEGPVELTIVEGESASEQSDHLSEAGK